MKEEHLLRLIAGMLGAITAVLLAGTLAVGKDVFVPFALALFGAFAAEPLVLQMKRVYIPRWIAALVVVGGLYLAVQTPHGDRMLEVAANAQPVQSPSSSR